MKILCIIDSLGSGGAQRQLVELAKGFKSKCHEVKFITYHEINFFKPELEKNGISVETIIEPNYIKRFLKIRKVIKRENPDSVLSFLEAANFISTLSGFPFRKWKLVIGERSANPNILKSSKLRFYRFFHLFADYVVSNSYANMQMVEKINPYIKSKRKKVIYNIVDVANIEINKNEDRDFTKIVVAASYRSVKNLDGLIEAIHLLPYKYKCKLKVEWYGNVDEEKYFLESINKIEEYELSNIIELFPAEKNIFEKYINADFVGLFSHYEGFPNAICEGMALNKPIIVSKVSDIPLFIKEDINGFICNSYDIESIKNSLEKAIKSKLDERIAIGVNNGNVAKENFNKNVIVQNYLKLLR